MLHISETALVLLRLAAALFVGLMLSRLAKKVGLPAVTAYIIAGVLIGPSILGKLGIDGISFISEQVVGTYDIICDVALGYIAFMIGNEFRTSQLKKIGKAATVIGILQAVFTTLVVDAALIGLHFLIPDKFPLSAAITLGAIAAATAPAATLMVVKQYKAKGTLTDILLPIVALDDAVGLMIFAVSFGVARSLGAGNADVVSVLVEPILEVVLSLALGFVMGILLNFFEKFFNSRAKRMSISVAFVFATVALSMISFDIGGVHIGFSSLLVCMMLGTVFCNMCHFSEEFMDRVDRWATPILVLFFVISGAELDLSVFGDIIIVLVGVVYVIARSLGKCFGASLSARSVKCDKNIVRYLGVTLLPQAGVALGMAIKANAEGGLPTEAGVIVQNITLFAVLIYEIFGPMLTKIALTKAGDIDPSRLEEEEHPCKKKKKS